MSKIVILCVTNNIFNDSRYDIADDIIKIASTFEKIYPNSSIYISGLLPLDESWSVNRVTIDEINKSLQYQCIREGFIYIDQSIGWTNKNGELDPVLFYKGSLHLVEKGNVKLAETSCSTRTSSTNVSVSPYSSSYADSVYFKIREKEFPPLPAARFPYKNVTKFKSHYKSYNHSYSCSVSNGKLSCPVSVSNPVSTLGVKPSRIVSISKSICTVSISKSIRPVNVSKSTTPVNVSKSTSPVYVSKTIHPVIVSSSPVNVSQSSNPVNVPTHPRPLNISKPFCPVKISTCPARVSKCSRPVNVLTRLVNPIRSTYTERKNFVNLLHLSAFLWEFLLLMCIIMNNVDTNNTPQNIPLTGSYLQQFNLNLNVKFCYYRDVFNNFCNFRILTNIFNHPIHNIFLHDYLCDFPYFYNAGINWVGKQFGITLMFTKVSSFESLSNFLRLSTNFHFVFLSLLLLKLRKKKLIFFLFSFFFSHYSFKQELDINEYRSKTLQKFPFFSHESLSTLSDISQDHLNNMLACLSLKKIIYCNNNSYFNIILLLSCDISLNPGPATLKNHSWDIFKKRGLHIIHLNINSLLPKIDEIRHIAKSSNFSVIGLSETKLDDSVFDAEINIEGYTFIRSDRNRHGGGVACYVKQHLTFDVKYYFSNEIENIFIDIFLPKSKPFTLGFFYRPPNQYNFLHLIEDDFRKT